MKYLLKNPNVEFEEDKPFILRFNEVVKPAFNGIEYDPQSFDDIKLTSFQKDMLSTKARTFWLVSYYPISVIRYALEHMDGLTHWAFCIHDRDITPDGEVKKVHTHLLLYFDERVSMSYPCSMLHTTQSRVISRLDISNEWHYLIHDSDVCRRERKFLYSPSDRFFDDEQYWIDRCSKNENSKYLDMVDDFILVTQHKLSYRDYIRKYGAFAIMNLDRLEKVASFIQDDENNF